MAGETPSLGRLRWLAVVVPVALIGLVELLSDTVLDDLLPFPLDTAFVVAVVAACAVVLSALAFRQIGCLTEALNERNRILQRQIAAGRALQRVGLAVRELSSLQQALQLIVDEARQLLEVDAALLLLEDAEGSPRQVFQSDPHGLISTPAGPQGHTASEWAPQERPGEPIGPAVDLSPASPVTVGAASSLDHLLPPSLFPLRWEIPVQRGVHRFGRLVVADRLPRTTGPTEGELLVALANQAAIALEHDRLEGELRALAVHAERERIAREMHDGLAQVLGYVNTKSQAVEALLRDGRVDEAQRQLGELAAAARSVYVDVREAILGLTIPIDPERGLVEALETYARAFADAAKVAVEVIADDAARTLPLPPAARVELFKAAQEALTNVRKHAAAGRVSIRLQATEGALAVEIADDGRGFDPTAVVGGDWPHYGLRTMRERLAALGGTCDVESSPGMGTRVTLRLPLGAGGMGSRGRAPAPMAAGG
jgi:signal transduction histidine kinase